MQRIYSDGLWNKIRKLSTTSRNKRAAVAYVSDDAIVKFGKGDLLVVDASNHAISSGQTSAPLIKNAVNRGAQVYSLEGLHAKVILFDDTAVIGSANVSRSSVNLHVEADLVTDNPVTASMARAFIEGAKQKAIKVDGRFIARIMKIKVVRAGWPKGKNKKKVLDPGNRSWLVGVHDIDVGDAVLKKIEKAKKEAERKKTSPSASVDDIRIFGNSSSRKTAKPGDLIVQMIFDSNWRNGKVHRHARIIDRKEIAGATSFFIEMPRGHAKTALGWREFKAFAKRVGMRARLKPWTDRRLRERDSAVLYDAWGK